MSWRPIPPLPNHGVDACFVLGSQAQLALQNGALLLQALADAHALHLLGDAVLCARRAQQLLAVAQNVADIKVVEVERRGVDLGRRSSSGGGGGIS